MPKRILAFQPWDGGSHRAVRRAIERHAGHEWTFRTMPGRGPRWRLRLAGLAFATEERRRSRVGESPEADAVFATGMLSLSDLRATLPPRLRDRPHVLYMHENQIAYPASPRTRTRDRERDTHLAFTNLASIEAADRIIWNSAWNRGSFIDGMEELLAHAPEPIDPGWRERLERRSVVIPPPIERLEPSPAREPARAGIPGTDDSEHAVILHNTRLADYPDAIRIVWPHRWEHDKGCDELLEIIGEARRRETAGGPRLHWLLLGQPVQRIPESMRTLLEAHADRIEHAGRLPRAEYVRTLRRADWVLSTARHEFYGIAVAEALLAGCLPWLPDRLSYPELVPAAALGLDPWNTDFRTVDPGGHGVNRAELDRMIAERLERADATVAVPKLESVISDAIEDAEAQARCRAEGRRD
ncbi:MAG: hypothetical protein CMJ27_05275 [Phycisphaerae bacterium]|nr:hypothetical protein [Phycisphaerae bacterium]